MKLASRRGATFAQLARTYETFTCKVVIIVLICRDREERNEYKLSAVKQGPHKID